ncbi:hypothetical protein K435DRAFT_879885 [Dendrothele bispora CBS 962.96]|uniref:Uncharacterized protein n=1 Tax=Dendrothele bispora (strain CBS 962.96) TaxID=1314807 RepID=A0A4S8KKH7_DENBC|nr:hypothetical protein K435DRAFT_879885 [Dendrothele bispora CBS 962.96]
MKGVSLFIHNDVALTSMPWYFEDRDEDRLLDATDRSYSETVMAAARIQAGGKIASSLRKSLKNKLRRYHDEKLSSHLFGFQLSLPTFLIPSTASCSLLDLEEQEGLVSRSTGVVKISPDSKNMQCLPQSLTVGGFLAFEDTGFGFSLDFGWKWDSREIWRLKTYAGLKRRLAFGLFRTFHNGGSNHGGQRYSTATDKEGKIPVEDYRMGDE